MKEAPRRTVSVAYLALTLLAGCAWQRELRVDSTAAAYDVRPLRGQDERQTSLDIQACKAKLLREPGQLEPRAIGDGPVARPMGTAVAVEAERAKRYERCMTERGYSPELRPMAGGSGERGR